MIADLVRKALGNDLHRLAEEPYLPSGIPNSEMAIVVALARTEKVEVFIESGRKRGHSTGLLSKYLPGVAVHSIERNREKLDRLAEKRLAVCRNLTLHYGDAFTLMPGLVKKYAGQRIAIMCDGPKGKPAIALIRQCADQSSDVVLGFLHDMRNPPGDVMPQRAEAEATFKRSFFTDDPDYVAAFRHLDAKSYGVPGADWSPFERAGEPNGSYGPTMGCFWFR